MTTMRPISAQYDELARLYGCESVWAEMEEVSRMDDDDEVTPEDRLDRVRTALIAVERRDELSALRESLAEVTACLAGDAGVHRDLLQRLRDRLVQTLNR